MSKFPILRRFQGDFWATSRSLTPLSAIKGHRLKPTTLLPEELRKTRRLRCETRLQLTYLQLVTDLVTVNGNGQAVHGENARLRHLTLAGKNPFHRDCL